MTHYLHGRGRFSTLLRILASTLFILLTASCTKHSAKPETQLAAKVGAYEITQYQVDTAVSSVPSLKQENVAATKEEIVRHLVERELLVQKAMETKLDRTPQVQAAIDSARQDILAKAYVAQVVGSLPPPGEGEVKQYYDEHPELFAGRKLYTLKEIRLQPATPDQISQTLSASRSGKNIDEIAQTLRDEGLKFESGTTTRAPEALPLQLLPAFFQAKDGAILGFPLNNSAYVAQIVNTRAAPVDEATASPKIRQFLLSQRDRVAITDELSRLRAVEKVQYFGAYQNLSNDPETSQNASPSQVAAGDVAQPELEQKP